MFSTHDNSQFIVQGGTGYQRNDLTMNTNLAHNALSFGQLQVQLQNIAHTTIGMNLTQHPQVSVSPQRNITMSPSPSPARPFGHMDTSFSSNVVPFSQSLMEANLTQARQQQTASQQQPNQYFHQTGSSVAPQVAYDQTFAQTMSQPGTQIPVATSAPQIEGYPNAAVPPIQTGAQQVQPIVYQMPQMSPTVHPQTGLVSQSPTYYIPSPSPIFDPALLQLSMNYSSMLPNQDLNVNYSQINQQQQVNYQNQFPSSGSHSHSRSCSPANRFVQFNDRDQNVFTERERPIHPQLPKKKMNQRMKKKAPQGGQPTPQRKFGHRSKQRKIEEVHTRVQKRYIKAGLWTEEQLRGPDVVRIHVKSYKDLRRIEEALDQIDQLPKVFVKQVAAPISMKNDYQKKGFILYFKVEMESEVQAILGVFNSFPDNFNKSDVALTSEEKAIRQQAKAQAEALRSPLTSLVSPVLSKPILTSLATQMTSPLGAHLRSPPSMTGHHSPIIGSNVRSPPIFVAQARSPNSQNPFQQLRSPTSFYGQTNL